MKNIYIIVLTFALIIGAAISSDAKPQDPKEPYPYEVAEVTFENTNDNIKIGATITYPKGEDSYPIVIMLNGSGAQDRNSEIFGHKPFWVIADYLSRNGIATLRMDDRGVSKTGGTYGSSSLQDFVEDAEFAKKYIEESDNMNISAIGVLGHSLGGSVATIMASSSDDFEFVVLMASAGIRGDELMLLQKSAIESKMGMTDAQVEASRNQIAPAYKLLISNKDKDNDELKLLISKYFNTLYNGQLPPNQLNGIVNQLTAPWMVEFISAEPADYLKNIDCRVLAINGTNDLQVLPEENLAGIRKGLEAGGNNKLTVKKYDGLNHLFQESTTGLPNEYSEIEQTISPKVLEIISNWIIELN
jgi:pimeloyl-ACP methyl ester carboxylesterase